MMAELSYYEFQRLTTIVENDKPKDALPEPRWYVNRRPSGSKQSVREFTFAMDPQERTDRHPVFEFLAFNEPCGSSLLVRLTRNIIICVRVWRRKPFVNALFYLSLCIDSASTKETR